MVYEFERFVLLDDKAILDDPAVGKVKSVKLSLDVDPQTEHLTATARVAFESNPVGGLELELRLRHLKKFGPGEVQPEVLLQLFDLLRSLKTKDTVKGWVPLVQTFQLIRTQGSRAVAEVGTALVVRDGLVLNLQVQPNQRFKSAAMVRVLDCIQVFVVQSGSTAKGNLLIEFQEDRKPEFYKVEDVTALKTAAHRNLHFISDMAFRAHFLRLIRQG